MKDRDTERMKKGPRQKKEALTRQPSLVLEVESVITFWSNKMHKHCVPSHRRPDYIAEGKTF